MKTEEVLFALIASVIDERPITNDLMEQLSPECVSALFRLAKKHDLAHLLAAAIDRSNLAQSEDLRTNCQNLQLNALYRYEQSQYTLECLSAFFAEKHVPFVPLKGAVIRPYYPEPWMRTSCDLDILVPEERVEWLAEAMESELGYVRRDKTYHDISLQSPHGVHVELHFNIKENMDNIDMLLGKVWEYTVGDKASGLCELTAEYLLFHHLAHMSYHFLHGGCGVRPILDWWILKRKLDYSATKLKEMCTETGISVFSEAIDDLASVWFDGAALSTRAARMTEFILFGGVYGNIENRITIQRVGKNEAQGKAAYIFSRAWLPLRELRTSYPILERRPYLLPIYQIKRWIAALSSGRVKKSASEIKVNNTISAEQIENVADLLSELGL